MESWDLKFSLKKTAKVIPSPFQNFTFFHCWLSYTDKDLVFFFQEPIESRIRTQILSELKDLGNISDLLSTLEMAIGFLSTAGGDPERKIFDYLKNVLHLSDGKSNLKSKKVCNIAWFYWSISHD